MAGKGIEGIITSLSNQLANLEVAIDEIYYGNPLKKNSGVRIPGSNGKVNGILPIAQEIAKIDLCNILTFVLSNTDLSKIAGEDSAAGKKIKDLKSKAKKLASQIDSGEITSTFIKDPKKLASLTSTINSISTAIDADTVSIVPQLANVKNYIDDVTGNLSAYSNLNTIPNADVQRVLSKIRGVQDTLYSISTISSAQDVVNVLNNAANINLASQIQNLQKVINPAQLLPTFKRIATTLRSINQIALKVLNFVKILQVINKVAKVLVTALEIIRQILSLIPIPNIVTVVTLTQKFSDALQTIKKFLESALKRIEQIGKLVELIYSFILGLVAKIGDLLVIVETIIFNLETCQVTADSPVVDDLKDSRAKLRNIKDRLDNFAAGYTKAQAERSGLTRQFNGYTMRIVEEEVVDPSIKNRRRKAIAVDPRGVLIAETQLTFATDIETLYAELSLLLKNKGIATPGQPSSILDSLDDISGVLVDDRVESPDQAQLLDLSAQATLEVSEFIKGIKKGGRKFKKRVAQITAQFATDSAKRLKSDAKTGKFNATNSSTSNFQGNLNKSIQDKTPDTGQSDNPQRLSLSERDKWQKIAQNPLLPPTLRQKAIEILAKDDEAYLQN